jgi:hypothetical protein
MNEDIYVEFPPYLQKQVDLGESGTDIMHGHLKNLMVECEDRLHETMESDEQQYWEGRMDTLTEIYILTYNLAFAISDRSKQNG